MLTDAEYADLMAAADTHGAALYHRKGIATAADVRDALRSTGSITKPDTAAAKSLLKDSGVQPSDPDYNTMLRDVATKIASYRWRILRAPMLCFLAPEVMDWGTPGNRVEFARSSAGRALSMTEDRNRRYPLQSPYFNDKELLEFFETCRRHRLTGCLGVVVGRAFDNDGHVKTTLTGTPVLLARRGQTAHFLMGEADSFEYPSDTTPKALAKNLDVGSDSYGAVLRVSSWAH